MTDQIDGSTSAESSEAEGTTESPEPQTTTQPDPLALARKRQAGAEAARQEATRQLAEANRRLAEYDAKDRTTDQTKAADIATLQTKLEAAERRAAEADAKAEARILDVKFPNARKQLPEVTDEVRLSYFEALLTETTPEGEPPEPQNPNQSNRIAQGDATVKAKAEETSEDILARLKTMTPTTW